MHSDALPFVYALLYLSGYYSQGPSLFIFVHLVPAGWIHAFFFPSPLQFSSLYFSSLRALPFLISLLIHTRDRRRLTGSYNVRRSASFSPS
jgi:hypothetical protein